SEPLTARTESRISSADRRRGLKRHRYVLPGSIDALAASSSLLIWYARESMISFCIDLIDQPLCMKRVARKSSRAGLVGGWPRWPKSLGVETIPFPKWYSQIRLAMTRA